MFEDLVPLIIKMIAFGGIAVMGILFIWVVVSYLKNRGGGY